MSVETIATEVVSHLGPWTEDDYFALGETPSRIELVDGVLVVSPMPDNVHQLLVMELAAALRNARPAASWVVYAGLNVRLWPGNVRIPDVVVARWTEPMLYTPAADVLLVAEITSPGNFRQDRIAKHGEYAEAGIPFYLRVDLHLGVELTATLYELVDGAYAELAHAADGVLRLTQPWPVELDLRAVARG